MKSVLNPADTDLKSAKMIMEFGVSFTLVVSLTYTCNLMGQFRVLVNTKSVATSHTHIN